MAFNCVGREWTARVTMEPNGPYLLEQIRRHVTLCFNSDALSALDSTHIYFGKISDHQSEACSNEIWVPVDVKSSIAYDDVWYVPFNRTTLTLWGRVPKPERGTWVGWPSAEKPIWWRNSRGGLIPAWN